MASTKVPGAIQAPFTTNTFKPAISNVYLTFEGVGFSSGKKRGFSTICGPNPPTVTGGYGEWDTLKMPLQRGYTIFQGYSPVQMTVNVIFGAWVGTGWLQDDNTGKNIAKQIDVLEWMAGANFKSGPPPWIYMWSYMVGGGQTNLIPPQYQSTSKSLFPWVINGGLQPGVTYRNPNGYRVWAEYTFVLENYLNLGPASAPDTQKSGGYYVTTAQRNTAILIAGAPDVASPIEDHQVLAARICTDPKNNPCKGTNIRLARKGIYYKIRDGVSLWLPNHQAF